MSYLFVIVFAGIWGWYTAEQEWPFWTALLGGALIGCLGAAFA